MRIGINFGDNDFYNTFKPFMELLMKAINESPYLKKRLTKDTIANYFNEISGTIFNMFQKQSEYRIDPKYLSISSDNIYFNEEIDNKLETYETWANQSFFYIDTDNEQFNCW